MSVHVFYPNKNDKVEFTKGELEKLLKDVYNEGYANGSSHYPWYINTTPYYYSSSSSPYSTTISATNAALNTETHATLNAETHIDSSDNELKIVYGEKE